MATTRSTRSATASQTKWLWHYKGQSESCHGEQEAVSGMVCIDDCAIFDANNKLRPTKEFTFSKLSGGDVVGWYYSGGVKTTITRSAGHIRIKKKCVEDGLRRSRRSRRVTTGATKKSTDTNKKSTKKSKSSNKTTNKRKSHDGLRRSPRRSTTGSTNSTVATNSSKSTTGVTNNSKSTTNKSKSHDGLRRSPRRSTTGATNSTDATIKSKSSRLGMHARECECDCVCACTCNRGCD